MSKLGAFVNNMDARAWRTIWVSLALLGGVLVVAVIGAVVLTRRTVGEPIDLVDFPDGTALEAWEAEIKAEWGAVVARLPKGRTVPRTYEEALERVVRAGSVQAQ